MSAFVAALRHEWAIASANDRAHVKWGGLVAFVFVATAIAAFIMELCS